MAGPQNRDRYIIRGTTRAYYNSTKQLRYNSGANHPFEVVRNAPLTTRIALYSRLSDLLYRPYIGT